MKDKINIAELYRNWNKFSNKNKPSFLKEYTVSQFTFGFELEGFISRSGRGAGRYNPDGLDEDGYNPGDWDGYDSDGYDREGYDREGYNRNGYNEEGYDRDGHDWDGYDEEGYDREGYDWDGYDREGYDEEGANKEGNDRTQGPANFYSRNPGQKELPFPLKEAENSPKKYSSSDELKNEMVDYFKDVGDVTYTTLKSDGSLKPDYKDDTIFEIAGPVLPLTPHALSKTINFLQDLDMKGVYTNDTCGFHTHISWPNISALEVFWVICNISNDPESFKLATEFNDGEIDFTHEHYANVGRLKALRKIFGDNTIYDNNTEILNAIMRYLDGDKFNVFRIHQGAGTVEWRGPRKFLTNFDLIPEFFKTVWKLGSKLNQFLESSTIINTDITRKEFDEFLRNTSAANFDNKTSKFKQINRGTPEVFQKSDDANYHISSVPANLENEIKLGISKKLEGFNKQTLDKIKHFKDKDHYIYILNNSKGVPVAKSRSKFRPTQDPKVLINYYSEPAIHSDGKSLTHKITGAGLISSEGKKLSEKFPTISEFEFGGFGVTKRIQSDQGGTEKIHNYLDGKGNILLDRWFFHTDKEEYLYGWFLVQLEDKTYNFVKEYDHVLMTKMPLKLAERFYDGMAIIANQDNKIALINAKGTLLSPWEDTYKIVKSIKEKFVTENSPRDIYLFDPEIYGTIRDEAEPTKETTEAEPESRPESIQESSKFKIKFKIF